MSDCRASSVSESCTKVVVVVVVLFVCVCLKGEILCYE